MPYSSCPRQPDTGCPTQRDVFFTLGLPGIRITWLVLGCAVQRQSPFFERLLEEEGSPSGRIRAGCEIDLDLDMVGYVLECFHEPVSAWNVKKLDAYQTIAAYQAASFLEFHALAHALRDEFVDTVAAISQALCHVSKWMGSTRLLAYVVGLLMRTPDVEGLRVACVAPLARCLRYNPALFEVLRPEVEGDPRFLGHLFRETLRLGKTAPNEGLVDYQYGIAGPVCRDGEMPLEDGVKTEVPTN